MLGAAGPVFFAYYMSETSEGISLDNLVRKKQYITPSPHPLSSLKWVAARSNMTTGSNVKVLKLYKLQLFHLLSDLYEIFTQYSIHIQHYFKHNWKIRRFWVVDPLKGICQLVVLFILLLNLEV